MFNFTFPDFSVTCKECTCSIPLGKYRTSGLCDDCEFAHLTPPDWADKLQTMMKIWGNHKAS